MIDQDKPNEKKSNENKPENKEEENKDNNEIKLRSNNQNQSFKKISPEEQNNPPIENVNENKENKESKENNTENQKKEEESKKEDPLISCMHLNGEITDDDINNSPKVILEEESEKKIFNGEKIEINAGGMVGGRGAKDGVVIFSAKKIDGAPANNSSEQFSSSFKPDFELNTENCNIPKYPYIFSIYYKKEEKTYFIRAYSGKGEDNRILFVKLTNTYNLDIKQKEIISAGNIIFQVSPVDENNLEIVNLSKKDSSLMPKQTFYPSSKKQVTIGRQKDCDFAFPKDKSFSRIQTTFEYDEETKVWKIIDGSRAKSSTNGTWVFGIHSFPIADGMSVEILNTKIKISVINNN